LGVAGFVVVPVFALVLEVDDGFGATALALDEVAAAALVVLGLLALLVVVGGSSRVEYRTAGEGWVSVMAVLAGFVLGTTAGRMSSFVTGLLTASDISVTGGAEVFATIGSAGGGVTGLTEILPTPGIRP
jgi:hypothetical protein